MHPTWASKVKPSIGVQPSTDAHAHTGNMAQRKRAAPRQREEKLRAALLAKKKMAMKTRNVVPVKRTSFPFVYVGNLHSTITEEKLSNIFGKCGRIVRIQIRCSRGQAVKAGTQIPQEILTSRDRQYASIEFFELQAAQHALSLNDNEIDGLPIVVTDSAADLPEVLDILSARYPPKVKDSLVSRLQRKLPLGSLASKPTELFDDGTLKADRNILCGVSFAKCLV